MQHPSARLCLALLLLTGGAAAVASAACVASPDTPFDFGDDASACRACSADNSTCVDCWPGWALSSTGECVECTGSWCLGCDAQEPDFCTECGDWSGESEIGLYALDNGTCAECPVTNCMGCENVNGTCTQCSTGMGVVDDACQPCTDQEGCISCNGDLDVCEECFSGFFLDGSTGTCKRCPANCDKCDEQTCLECDSQGWVLDNATALCVACSEGCTSCPGGPDTCESCDTSYTNTTDGLCARCSDPHCTSCAPENPDQCLICASTSSDKWFGGPDKEGKCVPCKASNCAACQTSHAVCDWCEDGYFNDAALGDCTRCSDRWPHCTSCGLDATQGEPGTPACWGCEDGWDNDPSSPDGKCIPASS